MNLGGRHVLVTGGSSGIGRQVAVLAAERGARVSVVARSEPGLGETLSLCGGGGHASYAADLSDIRAVKPLVERIVNDGGPVDGFCHAAGIAEPRVLRVTNPDYVERMFSVHAFAFIEAVRVLSLKGNLSDGASIVGVSSVAAERGGVAQGAYSAAKAAMAAFAKPAAAELGGRGIRVNTIAFGAVDTAMYRDYLDTADGMGVLGRQYLGVIDTQSAAEAVLFLLGDSSKYITGSVIPVCGGY